MAKQKYSDMDKLEAMGLLAKELSIREVSEMMKIPYPKIRAWKQELDESIENKNLADLIDVDEAVVKESAKTIADKLITLDPSQTEAIEGELLKAVDDIDGYKRLSDKTIACAEKLVAKISAAAELNPGTAELESLVISLTKIQEAFFNKNQTNIAVFGGGNNSNTGVSQFRSLQKA